ncbi:phage head closure protein [Cytobacillus oceanisediminis]|uniref:phage head closure protein n=1 Tax=Cytobacillus oceanisediminis TaxID=665099 RepID=UPI002079E0EF|nr:phage head closure protein [Cytobacillus oceanisediminis]MBY0157274.1 phage head closure protein [Cytobacillus firmus]USK46274.1 phage head closure protein [Cytobacillus oceanisediminis]
MLSDEFPHSVTFWEQRNIPDGGGGHEKGYAAVLQINGFMDTPSSREVYEAQKLDNPLERVLYYPYRTDITTDMRVSFESETYEITGRPQDQGGQHEIMRLPLRLIANG